LIRVARDKRLTPMERQAATEILRQIAETDASAVERERAAVGLLELGELLGNDPPAKPEEPPAKYAVEEDPAIQAAEKFLIAQPLDRVCERYLLESGSRTFLASRAGLNGPWVNAEYQRGADSAAVERKIVRLRKMQQAAMRVRDCFVSLHHDPHSTVDPAILGLLGIEHGADAAEKLAKAQAAYIALAAEGCVAGE
jgi:hypothetical protein